MQPTLDQLKDILRDHRDEMSREYGVAAIGIFGSYVRGEATEGSDIDILVEFDRPIGFFRFLEFEEKLAGWLGAPVDLVTKAALKPNIGKHILNEVAMV